MDKKQEELLNRLLGDVKNIEELEKLTDDLKKRGIQSLLEGEMSAHLGYARGENVQGENRRNGHSSKKIKTESGKLQIEIPRDREGKFDPVTVPKHKSMTAKLESVITLLYAKGMSLSDIVEYMDEIYGQQYSKSQITTITNSLLDSIREWQNRVLDEKYAILWIDGIHYKIREDGQIKSKVCMIVLGVNLAGYQDIIGMYLFEKETAANWATTLNDIKTRGVKDVLFICSDNLAGLDQSVEAVFPQAAHQICVVHQIRNSMKVVEASNRRKVAKDIKLIYTAPNEAEARNRLQDFEEKWGDRYPYIIKSWEKNWDNLTVFLYYPQEIRKLIYTTNIIEGFNAGLRKYTNNKRSFPNDAAAIKSIYLAAMQIQKRWKVKRAGWTKVFSQLCVCFPDRVI